MMSSDFNAALARFSFYNRPVTNKYPSSEFTLLEAYNYIIGGISSLATEQCRSMTEEQRKDFKKTHFDCCTFSGVFKVRNSASLVRHSMLFCFDFDHLEDVEAVFGQLIDDRYFETLLLFRSPSGEGLKWVVSMEQNYLSREKYYSDTPAKYHPVFFAAVRHYLQSTYQLEADVKCKDVARACFLPYDQQAYINPKLL